MTGEGFSWPPGLPTDPGFDWAAATRDAFAPLDPLTPHMGRVWNALAGGGASCLPVDRAFGDYAVRAFPHLVDAAVHRLAFRTRAVRALVGEYGIGQVLVAGTDLPLHEEVHDVAQQIDPAARVIYTDSDDVVMMNARAWLNSLLGASCEHVVAEPTDPVALLDAAAGFLDPAEPVGVLLINSLDPLDGTAAAHTIGLLRAGLPQGSCIAICQVTGPTSHGLASLGTPHDRPIPGLPHPRTPDDVKGLFAGLEIAEPGIVPASRWRPEPAPLPQLEEVGHGPSDQWCGLARIGDPQPGPAAATSSTVVTIATARARAGEGRAHGQQ